MGNETRGYYQLTTGSSYPTSDTKVLVNHTESDLIVLHLMDIFDGGNTSLPLNLTSIGNGITLETFHIISESELIKLSA